jgi:phosphoglucosamine mutase
VSNRYFGTDGIRGEVDGPLFEDEFLRRLAGAVVRFLRVRSGAKAPRIVAGRDTRASGERILGSLVDGFRRAGGTMIDFGVVPTPAVATLVREEEADLGIAITASHNPAADNGIKFFSGEGTKFSESEEARIEAFLLEPAPAAASPEPEFSLTRREGSSRYLRTAEILSRHLDLRGTKIVCDTANGATCETTPKALEALGAKVIRLGDRPDGENINRDCGSEHPERMAGRVRSEGAAVGVAHDGDGDRAVFSDAEGDLVPGDQILGIFALQGLRKRSLAANTCVTTVQSNRGLDLAVEKAGGSVVRTDVGDRKVAERMREIGASLGGESSGHYILHNYSTTGDGLLSLLYLLRILSETGRPLADLRADVPLLPQASANLRVREKIPLAECRSLRAAEEGAARAIGTGGRVMTRYSGTEPKLRFLVEAATPEECRLHLDRLIAAARADLEPEE